MTESAILSGGMTQPETPRPDTISKIGDFIGRSQNKSPPVPGGVPRALTYNRNKCYLPVFDSVLMKKVPQAAS